MINQLSIIKGIHPGFILERELRERKLKKGPFALSLQEFPQTIVSITKGKRRMNTALAMKIEAALGLEEGYLMILQVYYDIEEENGKRNLRHPDLNKLRPVLFWDTDIEMIKWERQKNAVIKRVFERGNEEEKIEIIHFYGKGIVDEVLNPDAK
jgi:plasmid maintenance system antidote protein VapI